ncbi:MAG: tRNA 2-thiouridine(34) synthase MnmA [Actinobacteria bacterium]|nr:tRNA 2-thiouridine(34) synthase MnmA [Actinomycetota bacterium]
MKKAVVASGSGGAGGLGRRSPRRPKAVIAMSGGVDSSVAAALLKEDGYDVTGIMLKLWKGDDINNASGCCSLSAADDARRVADVLDIPFYVHNFADRFEETVIDDFRTDYLSGRTPNPCVRCNQWIKFGTLLDRARALGADVLATGHYARVEDRGGHRVLKRGVDRNKDQSYVLWMLSQSDLEHVHFPVGPLEKTETRTIAESLGLRTARKPDSQEICFVRDGDFGRYVDEHISDAAHPGPIVGTDGDLIGEHRGFGHYTVGQRKGLGISLGAPVFVTSIDPSTNTITVGDRDDLGVGAMRTAEMSFTAAAPTSEIRTLVQYRAHGEGHPAVLDGDLVVFDTPVEAVAPGQSAAFYSEREPDLLLGGGIISETAPAAARV